jgi:phytoene synthase
MLEICWIFMPVREAQSLSYYVASWEHPLLARAYAAQEDHIPSAPLPIEQQKLEEAYQICEAITKQHSRTFYLASNLLPPSERRAARALYSFCRTSDDLVDRATTDDPLHSLQVWRGISLAPQPHLLMNESFNLSPDQVEGIANPVALAWADTRARCNIPRQYAEQLIDGVTHDLTTTRYTTFADLAAYCYGVASTVGLMSMHIIGFAGREAIPYAIKLGVALQLTNILRDVGEDWRLGRLYLPEDELAAFNLTEADIAVGRIDNRWRDFMRFQVNRTRQLYTEALPGIALLQRRGRFAIAAAAELYQAILNDIETHDYDVFSRRAYVTDRQKLARLPGIWWRSATSSQRRLLA